MPHPSDPRRQDPDFDGRHDRLVGSEPSSNANRFVWRVLIESVVMLGLLVAVVFMTYKLGYLWLFDRSEEPGSAFPDAKGPTVPNPAVARGAGDPAQPSDAAGRQYLIQLSRALSINQAGQVMARLEEAYAGLLGSLKMSLRAEAVPGGEPRYYVVAGPLFSPVTAEDLCGQIEAIGDGGPCSVLPQVPAAAGVTSSSQSTPRLVAQGVSAEMIARVQRGLRDAGYRTGNVEGRLGPETADAIRAYQASTGMEPTGLVTTDLMDRLAGERRVGRDRGTGSSPKVALPSDAAKAPFGGVGTPGGILAADNPNVPRRRGENPLRSRADQFLKIGDLSSARLLYEYAFAQGDAAAAYGIALTFDPVYFQEKGVIGMKPDPENAVTWYRRAIDAGDVGATDRLEKLIQWLQRRSAGNEDARRILRKLQ